MPRIEKMAKQKRLIATRLMQISLLVDDYVYHQKSISERSAVAYINEIATYKDKCHQDVRSLQVIDKLTRCITAIIQEQQELHGAGEEDIDAPQDNVYETNDVPTPYKAQENDSNLMLSPVYSDIDEGLTQIPPYKAQENYSNLMLSPVYSDIDKDLTQIPPYKAQENDSNLMLSPVYSDIDEDLTQIPQCFEVENYIGQTASYIANDLDNNKDYNNQVEIVTFGMKVIEADSTIHVHNRDAAEIPLGMESVSEVINLCDEDIGELIQNHTSFRHEPEFSIQKAISNLSIDINETFTPFSQPISQSILDNLNTQNSTYQPQDTMVPPRNYEDVLKLTAILQKPATETVSFRYGPTKIILPTTKQKIHVQGNLNEPVKTYTKKMQKKETVCTKTTAPKTKRHYKKVVNACEVKAKNSIEKNTKNRKTKATNRKLQENKDLSIEEKPLPEVYTNKNKPGMQIHQKDIKVKSPTYQNIQTSASTNINFRSHNISKNAVAPMQNKIKTNYVQNLSWVENLRFVREIQVEEFEPFTDEGFWENCYLPANLNADDFKY